MGCWGRESNRDPDCPCFHALSPNLHYPVFLFSLVVCSRFVLLLLNWLLRGSRFVFLFVLFLADEQNR